MLIATVSIACDTPSSSNNEGCEAIFEYVNKELSSIDTLPGFELNNPKMRIQGTVFERDGETPAKNVIVYIYHTNRKGVYETKGNEKGWARRHGIYRGWIKTDDTGKYIFYTFRPAPYPGRSEPAHIHFTVKEPDKNEYYIDSIVFEDDPLLSKNAGEKKNPRGGNGIIKLIKEGDLLIAERDIILGLNVPNYE